jgi:hypothetical protein
VLEAEHAQVNATIAAVQQEIEMVILKFALRRCLKGSNAHFHNCVSELGLC